MRRLVKLLAAFLLAATPALAVDYGLPNPVLGPNSHTAAITGFGSLAATNASTLISTLTLGPNSVAWPASPGTVYVTNSPDSAGVAYVCPLGGTCTAANGIPLAVGAAYGFSGPASTMTVIAASTATVTVQF